MATEKSVKILAQNKKARSFFQISEKFETGIVLKGTEVKSIREGRISLKEAYCKIEQNEIFLINCNIAQFSHGNLFNHDPLRKRKLLLHKRQIRKITGKINERGFTCIPLQVYLKGNLVKLEIGLARGMKKHDRRQEIKKRDMQRDLDRQMKEWNRR